MTTPLDPISSDRPSPERGSLARLIVCERGGEWAVGLRRELPVPAIRVYDAVTEGRTIVVTPDMDHGTIDLSS